MKSYELNGFYNFRGKTEKLTGELLIDLSGIFSGDIVDHGSQFPYQKIRGRIDIIDDKTKLLFFKSPPSEELANLLYRLEKPSIEESFAGQYKGTWVALPEYRSVDLMHQSRFGLTLILSQLMPEHLQAENTEITLSEKK